MSIVNRLKAPNILILTEFDKDFNSVKQFIRNLLGFNTYTIYNIKLTQLKTAPTIWIDNCYLLITVEKSSNHLKEIFEEQFNYMKKFLESGGKILTLPSCLESNKYKIEKNVFIYDGYYEFELNYEKNHLKKVNLFLNDQIYSYNNHHFVSKICPNYYDIEGISGDVIQNKKSEILIKDTFRDIFTKELKLKSSEINELKPLEYIILTKSNLLQSPSIIEGYLKEYIDKESGISSCVSSYNNQIQFNRNDYFNNLFTNKLGHTILYTELANSTMNAIGNLPSGINNIVAIAKQQIQGVGNNKNEWLSPIGCAMFTVFINLNTKNFQSSRLCLLQYAAAIACVESIIQEPGYEHVPLKIKWPNDIFYENNAKLGGILVKSSIMSENLTVQIGIGVNIDNDHPTLCLNSVLKELNLEIFTIEKFISKCLNRLEYHIEKLRYELNLKEFSNVYEKYWLHRDQSVHVEFWNEEVQVIGIDDYGYLKVRRKNGKIHTLQPDGNRFDMMRNLIVFK